MKPTVSLALVFGVAVLAGGSAVSASPATEAQLGAQVYRDLAKRGALVAASPWYGLLNAMGRKIALVADRQYAFGFRFFLVNEKQPNAFAVPGGNIYVTVPMMTFVKTKEELAGVLCHEVAHDIHHDVPQLNQKAQTTNAIAAGLSLLIGGGKNATVGTVLGVGAKLQGMHYSRAVETNADLAGAKICAQAGWSGCFKPSRAPMPEARSKCCRTIQTMRIASRPSRPSFERTRKRSRASTQSALAGTPCRRSRR